MRARFLVIRNPRAGWHGSRLFEATLAELQGAGAVVESVATTTRGEGTRLAAQAARTGSVDAVVAAGGDGTVHDVAAGLVGTTMPFGVVPTGTGNVFVRELGHAFKAPALARSLREGPTQGIPIGQVNGEPFLFVVGVGFDAEAVRHFEAAESRHLGRAGYVYPVLRALADTHSDPIEVATGAGRRMAEWVIVTRIRHYAANLLLAPEADLSKPLLYVVRFTGGGRVRRLRQLAALMAGLVGHMPDIAIEATDAVTITGNRTCPVQIDGEVKGSLPLAIGLHPERLTVILPQGRA